LQTIRLFSVNLRTTFKEQSTNLKKANGFSIRISITKTKSMAIQGKNHVRCKIARDNEKQMEQVQNRNYLGFRVPYCVKEDINIKLGKFQTMRGKM
jgi:hypothetical protein